MHYIYIHSSWQMLKIRTNVMLPIGCIGDDASLDIVPVSGSLQFISNVRQQLITLSVKADDIPEVAEVQKQSVSLCLL